MRNALIVLLVMVVAVLGGLAIGVLTADPPASIQTAEETPSSAPAPQPQSSVEPTAESTEQPVQVAATPTLERRPAPPLSPISDGLEASEQALASPDLMLLFHLDVAVLAAIEKAFLGDDDPQALPPPLLDPDDLRQRLAAAGIDLGDAVDHLLAGLYARQGEAGADELGFATVLLGRMPVTEVEAALNETYQVERRDTQAGELLIVERRDKRTCDLQGPFAVALDEARIVAGTPWAVETTLRRLNEALPAERDLAAWQTRRSGKIFSFATLAPP